MTTGLFHTGRTGPRKNACRFRAAIRGMRTPNTQSEMYSRASLLAVQDKPVADVAAYQAWFAEQLAAIDPRARHHIAFDGSKVRRMVIMRRNGCKPTEIGRTLGLAGSTVSRWLDALPTELAA